MMSGQGPELALRPGSYLQSIYKSDSIVEEYFCNYEVEPDFEWAFMEAGFTVSARDAGGAVRAVESPAHRFFHATLFQPQLGSTAEAPAPLVSAFVQAAAEWSRLKTDDAVLD